MMTIEGIQTALGLVTLVSGGSIVGGVIWAIRQEGRINGHDQLFAEREKQADERHEDLKDRLIRIETMVGEIRRNGGGHK